MLLQTSLDLLVCTLQRVEVSMLDAVCSTGHARGRVYTAGAVRAAHARKLIIGENFLITVRPKKVAAGLTTERRLFVHLHTLYSLSPSQNTELTLLVTH